MAKHNEVSVVNQTAVLEKVDAVTRVYLGVAVGLGFVASALGFLLMPTPSGVVTAPLMITKVTDAKVILNADEQFKSLTYTLGSATAYTQLTTITGSVGAAVPKTAALKINLSSTTTNTNSGSTATSFSVESIGGATSFSIEPLPQNGWPAQMIAMAYKVYGDNAIRNITLCVGHSSAISLFVGADGSTFTNSSFGVLSGRTTNESCGVIKNRAMKVTQLTSGNIIRQSGNYAIGDYQFIRAFIPVGKFGMDMLFPDYRFTPGGSVTLQTDAPLYAGFNFRETTVTKPAAPAIITLTDQSTRTLPSTKIVCFPETTMNLQTGGPVYYYDTNGTPYYDIFLQNRAMTANCNELQQRMRLVSHITNVGRPNTIIWPESYLLLASTRSQLGNYFSDGRFWSSGPLNTTPLSPLMAVAQFPKNPALTYTIPSTPLTITQGDTTTFTICYPETTVDSATDQNGDSEPYYFDRDGQPYYDIFFTRPVLTTSCDVAPAKALKYDNINGGAYTPEKIWPFNITINLTRNNTKLASFTNNGITAGSPNITPSANDPVAITALTNQPINGTFTVPRTIFELVGATSAGQNIRTTLCYPETIVTRNGDTTNTTSVYFDSDGNAYKDIFLTQRFMTTNCSDMSAKSLKYSDITTATTGYISWPARGLLVLSGYRGTNFGTLNQINFDDGQSADNPQSTVPLRIEPVPDQDTPVGSYPTTQAHIALTGTTLQSTNLGSSLCLPELTMNKALNAAGTYGTPAFFDEGGNAYKDIFLTERYLTTDCNEIQRRNYTPTSISSVTMTPTFSPTHGVWIGAGKYHYGSIGSSLGWQDTQTIPSEAFGPFPLFFHLTGAPEAVTVPKVIVSFTDNMGTKKNLCWGGWENVRVADLSTGVFYDRDGKGYTDLFLTKPYTCPSDPPPSYANIQVSSISPTSATISWDTSVATCGRINYGTVAGQLNTGPVADSCYQTTNPAYTTGHQAILTGLTANTVYYYEIVSTNNLVSGQKTFTTVANTGGTGAYSNIRILTAASTYVTIGWETTRTTCSNINYGTVTNQLNSGPIPETTPCTGTSHQATISGLLPKTVYLYEIVGVDGIQPVVSGQQTFTTATSSGYYTNVRVISSTPTSATIGWDTSRTTCSNINYGTVPFQLNTGPANETAPCTGTTHQATINGLTAGTIYYYEIVGGGAIASGQQSFTAALSGPSGSYTNIRVISKTATSAVIGWDTTRTTCSNINYGTVSGQLNTGPAREITPCSGPTHQATLTGLTVGTKYYFQIVGGGTIVSNQESFTL